MATNDVSAARRHMVDVLDARGLFPDPAWRGLFGVVAREHLLRQVFLGDPRHPITADNPQWADLVYDPERALQVRPDTFPRRYAPSPRFCAQLLHGLDLDKTDHVLVGGITDPYPSVLLCHYLGAENVTIVDDDLNLLAHARTVLAALDLHPQLLHSAPATVDRLNLDSRPTHLLSAYPLEKIPPGWLTTVGVAGVIVAALGRGEVGGPIVRLVVADDTPPRELRADGWFLPGVAPRLGPGPHQDQPAEEFGLSLTVPYPTPNATATQHYWWRDPDHVIHTG